VERRMVIVLGKGIRTIRQRGYRRNMVKSWPRERKRENC